MSKKNKVKKVDIENVEARETTSNGKKLVVVPCVTKDVKAVDLMARQHGYAININLPKC